MKNNTRAKPTHNCCVSSRCRSTWNVVFTIGLFNFTQGVTNNIQIPPHIDCVCAPPVFHGKRSEHADDLSYDTIKLIN